MNNRIEWVRSSSRLVASIAREFGTTKPFDGLTIGTGIHLEPKTAGLLLALAAGGARVVATGNLNSTQQETVDYLLDHGIEVIGGPTSDPVVHDANLRAVLAAEPHLLLDNGGDLFARYLENPYPGFIGGTEETTSGRTRLTPLREQFDVPILVINDSPIKQFAENRHAVGQSVLESYFRLTNRSTQGKRVTVFGYGSCGEGVASNFRNSYAQVTVLEADPIKRLEACLDGFDVSDRDVAIASSDVIITVTGAVDIFTAADLPLLKDGAILMNAGHFPLEIDVPGILEHPDVTGIEQASPGIETLTLADGRRVHLASRGHMVNLGGPSPLGNSIESMDLGFALQTRCLEAIARDAVAPDSTLVPVPREIDERVANDFLATR